jgi:hypothetical protein
MQYLPGWPNTCTRIVQSSAVEKSLARSLIVAARMIQTDVNETLGPPPDGTRSNTSTVLPCSRFRQRVYLLQVARQINTTYETGCYDASAVLIRRLIETLLVASFEAQQRTQEITDANGQLKPLEDIIKHSVGASGLQLSRDAKRSLLPIKQLGDRSAHNRTALAHRTDIDKVRHDLRTLTDELLHLANLYPT